MKINKRFLMQLGLIIVVLIFGLGLALAAGEYEKISSQENMVRVEVAPKQLAFGRPAKFEVRMNTHSVSLNQDIVAISILKDNDGREYLPVSWDGSPPGGHHRSGILEFPGLEGSPNSVTLVIREIANVPERIFEWKVKH